MNKVNKIYKALKEGLISFDGAHAIHTPQALVEEVLSKIALQGDILVLFNVEFVISLVYTYNIAPENITFYSDHDNKSRFCSKLGVKYITSLETDMKFDVVLTNPPYQDIDKNPLYYKFHNNIVNKLLKPGGEVAEITPDAMAVALETGIVKGCHTVEKREIKLINISTDIKKQHFPTVGINNFCYFVLKNTTKTQNPYTIITAIGITQGRISPLKPLITGPEVDSILAKCFDYDRNYYGGSWNTAGTAAVKNISGQGRVVLRIDDRCQLETYQVDWVKKHKYQGTPKVFVSGFGNRAVACYDHDLVCATEKNLYTVPTKSDQESDRLVQLLDCDLREFLKRVIKARGDRIDFLRHFKGVPLTKKWTNKDLYQHFGLTKTEIDFINVTISA